MRRKKEQIIPFGFDIDMTLPKDVRVRQGQYQKISEILDAVPVVLNLVHSDLTRLCRSKTGGRGGDYTSETILRAWVVHFKEGLSLRETIVKIAESSFLQAFIRIYKKPVMDHSFLSRMFKAITPETVKRINEALSIYGVDNSMVDPSILRTDSTVVETNIHYPTDAHLLWDCYRVTARWIRRVGEIAPNCCTYRFHDAKIKKIYLDITRYSNSKSKKRLRAVRRNLRRLTGKVAAAVQKAEAFGMMDSAHLTDEVIGIQAKLLGYLPAMRKVVDVARRVTVLGETVPTKDRVYSIFEPHTELIIRGRRSKPVEFGHMIWISQTMDKFITDYEAMEKKIPDSYLTEEVINRHAKLFGSDPEVVAADQGYCPTVEEFNKLDSRIDTLAIPRRTRDFALPDMAFWQAFRAGVEGTISTLKRAFRLSRCMYKSFKTYTTAIGMGVFTHNLLVLSKSG